MIIVSISHIHLKHMYFSLLIKALHGTNIPLIKITNSCPVLTCSYCFVLLINELTSSQPYDVGTVSIL